MLGQSLEETAHYADGNKRRRGEGRVIEGAREHRPDAPRAFCGTRRNPSPAKTLSDAASGTPISSTPTTGMSLRAPACRGTSPRGRCTRADIHVRWPRPDTTIATPRYTQDSKTSARSRASLTAPPVIAIFSPPSRPKSPHTSSCLRSSCGPYLAHSRFPLRPVHRNRRALLSVRWHRRLKSQYLPTTGGPPGSSSKLSGFMNRCGEAAAQYDRGAQPAVP